MSKTSAPVALLGYRRPGQTQRVFDAIREARPPVLLLVMDGPKVDNPEDEALVDATRRILETVDWDCEVHRIYAKTNMGLKSRVSSGLDEVFKIVDAAIILEDDCLPSPSFFSYASELLERYASDNRVGMIGGHQRLRGRWEGRSSYLFSKDVRIWGWATWARTWKTFSESDDLDATWTKSEAASIGLLLAEGPRRRSMVSMMTRAGNLDSWALPFAVHCVRRGYLNPIPMMNLVRNIGFGVGSTHTGFENYVLDVPAGNLSNPLRHPSSIAYTYPVDEWESRGDEVEFFAYPIRHPLGAIARVSRYAHRRLVALFRS